MTSTGVRWKASPAADDKDDGGGATSISDVFADMLLANEDMIAAAAECQAEGDVQGLVAYQRILHRDLMEMAEFIDSMFSVYSNSNNNVTAATATTSSNTEQKRSDSHLVVDLTAEAAGEEGSALAEEKAAVQPAKREVQRGALLTAIEAGEKVREIQRSKVQWIKSRHQVLEEEGVSAIMKDNPNGLLQVPGAKEGGDAGNGGLALANQLRAHQHIAAFIQASKDAAATVPPPMMPMNLLLANQLAIPAPNPLLAAPAPLPVAAGAQQIKPNTATTTPAKIALPPAHSMFNMLFAFPGAPQLMLNPQVAGGLMTVPPWPPQGQAALPARTVVPARPAAAAPTFKRMCESCRKRHFSVRQCRLVLQHTDPEWQPAQPPPTTRRRRRKQPATNK